MHVGHEKLLARAFDLGEQVLIGVSGDALVATLGKGHRVNSFKDRVRELKRFLRSRGWIKRSKISELRDAFGPALRRRQLQALVVSQETRPTAIELNQMRILRGLPPLGLYVVRLAKARDGKPISVTRIRKREIDRTGKTINKAR